MKNQLIGVENFQLMIVCTCWQGKQTHPHAVKYANGKSSRATTKSRFIN